MLQEFKEFINKGNVIDLAVAVVMAAAFAPVVTAVVDRVLMPVIGMVVGQPNFDTIGAFGCTATGDDTMIRVGDQFCAGSIGAVFTALINFVLIGLAVFLVVKAYNRMNRANEEEPEPEADPQDVVLLREIRDSLQNR